MRVAAPTLFVAAMAVAPFQCASKDAPAQRLEEEPGEAVYGLAEKFRAAGDLRARTEALRYLVARYPTSRFAEAARIDLGASSGGGAGAPPGAP